MVLSLPNNDNRYKFLSDGLTKDAEEKKVGLSLKCWGSKMAKNRWAQKPAANKLFSAQ